MKIADYNLNILKQKRMLESEVPECCSERRGFSTWGKFFMKSVRLKKDKGKKLGVSKGIHTIFILMVVTG